MDKRAILIHGPTASGKTALAVACAEKLGGEVVNADAMQVYRDLPILTARPSGKETQSVPHHLFGYIDASLCHSVADWLGAARQIVSEIRQRDRVPIIVGGSGLYLAALTEGLAAIPDIPSETRAEARASIASGKGHADLRRLDPESADRIQPGDSQRIARALEVLLATGQPLQRFQQEASVPILPFGSWSGFALVPVRETLYGRIDRRFSDMLKRGALAEAQTLKSRNLEPSLPVMKSHGLPHLLAHLQGEITLEETSVLACRDTRRYAKRQYTWIAHRFERWTRLPARQIQQECQTMVRIYTDSCAIP